MESLGGLWLCLIVFVAGQLNFKLINGKDMYTQERPKLGLLLKIIQKLI